MVEQQRGLDWEREFEGAVKLTLKIGLEIMVSVKVKWKMEDVIEGCGRGVLKNGSEEFGCECEAPIVKWRDSSFHA